MERNENKMKRYSTNKITVIAFSAILVPFLLMCVFTYVYTNKYVEQSFIKTMVRFTDNESSNSVTETTKNISMLFQPILKIVTKEKLDAYLKGDNSEIERVANTIVNSTPAFKNVTISNVNGDSVTYPYKIRPEGYNVLSRPWYPKATEKNNVIFSAPYVSNENNNKTEKAVTVSMGILDEDLELIGNIAFDLDLKSMSSMLENINAPYTGRYRIASHEGLIVLSDNKNEILKRNIPESWMKEIANDSEDFYDAETETYVFYKKFNNPDWIAISYVKKSDFNNEMNSFIQNFITVFFICLSLYLIFAVLFRMYLSQMLSVFLMEVRGIDIDETKPNFEVLYKNIKDNNTELQTVKHDSETDALTQIYNRKKLNEDLATLIAKNDSFSFTIVDIDNFKVINDTFGHDAGDGVLKFVSRAGTQVMGDDYHLYRFGGEELVVLFPGNDYEEHFQLVDTWRKIVSHRTWRESPMRVTFSAGITIWQPGDSAEHILKTADMLLYKAKHAGKNQVMGNSN